MAENLIILVAVASVVGVFFLVLFTALARRKRRALRKLKGANPSTRGIGTLQSPGPRRCLKPPASAAQPRWGASRWPRLDHDLLEGDL